MVPDTEKFARELRAKLEQIEQQLRATIDVDVDLNSDGAVAHMRELMTRLRAMARDIDIDVDVDQDRLGGIIGSLGRMGNSAGFAGKQFMGLTRVGWIVVAVFAAAAPLIGLVAGLIAGLPSLLSAAGAGAAAIALGMDGIKNAASQLSPQLDALKASVSEVFESRLTPMFEQLGAVFPALTTGMSSVANGLSDMMQGFVDVVTSAQGLSQIETILNNTGTFFSQLQPMMAGFTSAFLTLSTAGSQAFGYLSGSLNNFATQFNDMVNRITSNGVFDSAMQGLSQVLDGILDMFTRLMEVGATAMGQLGGPLQTMLGGLTDFLVSAMPALTAFSGGLANVIGALGTGLAPIITALTPAFTALMDILGTVLVSALQSLSTALTPVAQLLGDALLIALQAIQPFLPVITEAFSQLATIFAGAIAQAAPIVLELMTQLATIFAQLFVAIQPLIPMLLQLVEQILTAIIQLLPPLMPLIEQIASSVIPALIAAIIALMPVLQFVVAAISAVISVVTWLAEKILGFLVPAFQMALEIATGTFNAIKAVIEGAINIIIGIVSAFAALFTGNWEALGNALRDIWDAAWKMVGDILNAGVEMIKGVISHLPADIQSWLGDLGSTLVAAGKSLMDGLLSGIKSGLQSVLDFAGGIADKIAAVKGPLPYDRKVLIPAGNALMEGLNTGLNDGFQDVLANVRKMANEIGESFGIEDVVGKWDAAMAEAKIGDVPMNFAKSTGEQFLQDLGIQGNGALPELFRQAVEYHFHVNSVDEAMQAKQTQQNKESLQYTRR
ncbi:hypothetical protein N806_31175 [Rhodococcus sp. P27]|nr:hypothetical protein N806_31175 [Rhodococcus sp. P27]